MLKRISVIETLSCMSSACDSACGDRGRCAHWEHDRALRGCVELLAEKLLSSRSTVERRLRSYLASGRVLKERRGKSVVYLLSFDHHEKPEPDMSVDMVRSVMAMVLDISND